MHLIWGSIGISIGFEVLELIFRWENRDWLDLISVNKLDNVLVMSNLMRFCLIYVVFDDDLLMEIWFVWDL